MKIGKVIFAVCAAAVGVAALSLSACRSCSSRTLEGAAEVQAAPSAGEVPVAAGGERNDMRKDKENIMTYAVISTEKGDMKAELYTKETPGTAQNFIKLAESGFYDGLTFHRVIPGFVIQGDVLWATVRAARDIPSSAKPMRRGNIMTGAYSRWRTAARIPAARSSSSAITGRIRNTSMECIPVSEKWSKGSM